MTNSDFLIARHILACLHFNENTHRETKMLGEEMVREIPIPATYGMCK